MKKFLVLLCVLGVLSGASYIWYLRALAPVNANDDTRQSVKIEKGSSVKQIAATLDKEKVIRSPLAFELYVRSKGLDTKLQAGTFIMKQNQGVPEIAEALTKGIGEEGVITIPEGFTVKDIDAVLAEKGVIEAGELMACAKTCDFSSFDFLPQGATLADCGGKVEGYLYPDTYFIVVQEFVPKFFLERLLGTFDKKVLVPLEKDLAASDRSLHEIVTMASLIEEETRTDNERPTVAGILWKRYDAGDRK